MALHFEHIVYGPIKSRRLGNSLGINLSPMHGKLCSFDCIYCECGWNKDGRGDTCFPSKEDVFKTIEDKLKECKNHDIQVDTITFSGNGEPTMHPDFSSIIDFTLKKRNEIFPGAKVSVLSNATQLGRKGIKEALARVDNPILKIDSALDWAAELLDRPQSEYSVNKIIEQLEWFKGNFILQTMFLKGDVEGIKIDSTDPVLANAWVDMVLKIEPREVMMYTLDRVPPLSTLYKVTVEQMQKIARPIIDAGINVSIKG